MSGQAWSDDEVITDEAPLTLVRLKEEDKPWKAKSRPVFMIDFCFADGESQAFQYHDLVTVRTADNILTLHFYHATVKIRGQHLAELRRLVLEHKAAAVLEKHQSEFEQDESRPYIYRIAVDRPDLEIVKKGLVS